MTVLLQGRGGVRSQKFARGCWFAGCLFFGLHVVAAFQFVHGWSHAAAAEDTRRQTLERTGIDFGGGIYFNYLLALVWAADVAGGIPNRPFLRERSRTWSVFLHGFFLFMIFNSTVVFGRPEARVPGLLLCIVVLTALLFRRPRSSVFR
jgi:hypothetical protein